MPVLQNGVQAGGRLEHHATNMRLVQHTQMS